MSLTKELKNLWCVFDISRKEKIASEIELKSSKSDFWNNPENAQSLMQQLSELRDIMTPWKSLSAEISENKQLLALSVEEKDDSLITEAENNITSIEKKLNKLEGELIFSGSYDSRNAIIAIHAGAGGTESQDWASILLRMYLRWAERRRFETEILDSSPGDEAGIKSTVVEIKGKYAYGYLKSEHGVHRLVRLSPFDADHARHTSFSLVEVLPQAKENIDIKINPDDLRIDTFRSSGPGGQHMQKTNTAVRIVHIPSGITITCQSERSQYQNKEIALKILTSKLLDLEIKKREEEKAKIKGKRIIAGWGNQIRSYILHPYRLVKDHRTDYQTSDAPGILDGDLDEFIITYLRSTVGKQ